MASEAARNLLEYFRDNEIGPGTTGPTGTPANKLFGSMAYSGPDSPGLVPGRVWEREPASTGDGNKDSKEDQWLILDVPAVPGVPDEKIRGCRSSSRPAFDPKRAAIEYDAGVPREWAEGYARLCLMPCPPSVALGRWQALADAAGRFLDRWGVQAAALGWSAADVFGCHPLAPAARYDLQGLVWLLGPGEVVAITDVTATIRHSNGTTQTFRRAAPVPGERVAMAWELEANPGSS